MRGIAPLMFFFGVFFCNFIFGTRYGVPSADAAKFDACFEKHLADEVARNPKLIHDITTMVRILLFFVWF